MTLKNCGGCGSWIPDDAASCPSCGRGQEGGEAAPPEAPAAAPAPGPGDGERLARVRARTEARIRTLGILYIVYGALLVGMVALSVAQQMAGDAMAAIEEMRRQWPPEFHGWVDALEELNRNPAWQLASHFLPFALGAFAVWSGVQLRGLRGRTTGIAVAVAILALTLCQSCCCCLGLPLGIWALVVLTSGQAKTVMAP